MDGCFTFQRGKSGDSLAPGPLLSHTLGLTSNHQSQGKAAVAASLSPELFFTSYCSGSNLVTAKIHYLLLFREFQNGKSDDSLAPGPLLSHTLGLTLNHHSWGRAAVAERTRAPLFSRTVISVLNLTSENLRGSLF